MGHKLQRKSYQLTFGEGTPLEGATVVMGGMTIGEAEILNRQTDDPAKAQELLDEKFTLMASRLQSWDLEDDKGEIPTTLDGLKRLELSEMLALQQAWGAAVSTVAAPLPAASSAGGTQMLEVSIPMETLPSTSQESSPTPSS